MSTAELKVKLINEIAESNNENLLLEVYRLMDIETENVAIYQLTDEQISVVREAQAEVKAGKFLTDDEINKEMKEWLEE